ncbi:transcription antiterminator BglG [Actinobacillus succinogenes]|uniref:Transcriptional antiterminator, BglG n=1 Tax=Actinobacillus succinogenes (strain ATCC 55618 / DSM 22257 / CCUG 43843 / 130Z) TaxID=339671 RepID=A6VMZ3_ACTSZ|nr:PRD domain-containing protein [Actinobacillus succinogenes]ABR74340.1 transcriptional antiterminator, BglG [Actinobacillus succinogenes 130Z]PHI41179.1 transcription antiterminator BglG [Actinobacillus succinogenes]
MLKITKIFNNNAIQAENELQTELVVLGKGVAFGKKVGDSADESLVEKTFSLNKSLFAGRLTEILSEIPQEYFQLTNCVVDFANQQLGTTLSNSIFVSLPDHIFHAVERAKQNQTVPNGLLFEIQRLYKQEFAIGLYTLQLIEKRFGVQMTEDEAGFIALHIFNARTDGSTMADTYKATQMIKDILNMVGYHFNLVLDENSYDYARFLTHLQHFAQRFFVNSEPASGDDFLYRQTKIAYPKAYQCVEKINKYLTANYHKPLNEDEQLYLMIHIRRIISHQQ